ncbi:TIGR03086 family metal-binding protein [Streptomyces ovatisporus]|uniref:TIGR03086 family metal-binding protein n=1 Tax=Streptomyces ovatisporus TaxID=1128682 RepID=A0ABV9AEB3_9ACTN
MIDLGPQARHVKTLLDGVSDGQLGSPTPCESYTVADLLAHFLGLTAAFRDAARKELGPTTDTDPGDAAPRLPADWRSRLAVQLDELAAAWRSEDAWEGETRAGGVELPGAVAGTVALNELVLHGWDLARATGQPYTGDPGSLRVSVEMLSESAGQEMRDSIFGPVVEVPPDAPLLDRAVGLGGRRPDWTPPSAV